MRKSLVELNAELDALKARALEMVDNIEKEQRKFNADEEASYNAFKHKIAAKEEEIRQAAENQPEIINPNQSQMEKQTFSFLRAIRGIVSGNIDEVSSSVIAMGREEMRKAGRQCDGSLVIPIATRAAVSVTNSNGITVPVEVANIFDEVRNNSVTDAAGAIWMTGLIGDVKVPVMGAAQVAWAGEVASAGDGNAAITGVTLSPKRLTAYIDISKQLLTQESQDVEFALQQNLIRAVSEKLESTILGSAAGSATQPKGIFNGVTPTACTDFGKLVDLEATIDGKSLNNIRYIASPKAKAKFRAMSMNNQSRNVWMPLMQDGEVDGTPLHCTANVAENLFAVGDWSNLVIGQFGALDITVDPYTKAGDGEIRLVINAYVDAQLARDGVIAFGTVAGA